MGRLRTNDGELVTYCDAKLRNGTLTGIALGNWMLNPADPRDITVEFQNTKDGSAMKTLKGTGCYCVHYKEFWEDGQEHYEDILLSCQKLENGPVAYENPWR